MRPDSLALRCAVKSGLIGVDKDEPEYLDTGEVIKFFDFWALYEAEFRKCFLFKKPVYKIGYVPPALDHDAEEDQKNVLNEFKQNFGKREYGALPFITFLLGFLLCDVLVLLFVL